MTSTVPDAPQFIDARRLMPRSMRMVNGLGRFSPWPSAMSRTDYWSLARRRLGTLEQEPTAPTREALGVLCDAVDRESDATWIGRFAARDDTLRLARTHLKIEAALRAEPEIERKVLPPAIFIIGLPRTGTTFLHQLLACDPANRTLPYWESFDPVPPPDGRSDERARRLEKMLAQLDGLVPEIQAIHPMSADATEECVALFMNVFRTLQLDIQYHVPSYVEWLLDQDAHVAYEAYRRQLQLVCFHRPAGERLLLKDPTHSVHLETIPDLFPDAKFIFIHRDPARSISSIASLYSYTRAVFTQSVDPVAIGAEIMNGYWPQALDAQPAARAGLDPARCVDVRQADLSAHPLEAAERIYAALGLPWSEACTREMTSHVEARTAMKRPKHIHALEGFGLREEAVRDRFKDYCERFDL